MDAAYCAHRRRIDVVFVSVHKLLICLLLQNTVSILSRVIFYNECSI
jgi:hypothetical protein